MTNYLPERNKILGLIFFIGIAMLFWLSPSVFFWNDDWYFVSNYLYSDHITYIFTSYFGHVKPFFKAFYFSELFLFGQNTVFFQVVALALFGATGFLFHRIFRETSSKNIWLAWLIPVLLIAHPNCGEITLWLFEVCIILHFTFQAMAIFFYFRYTTSKDTSYFYLFILAVIIQNYSFGNGVFFPMLFIMAEIIEYGFKINKRIVLLAVLQVIFIIVQKFLSSQQIPLAHLLHDYRLILQALYDLVSISITRFFIVKAFGGRVMESICLLLFALLCVFAYRNNRRRALFCLAYLLISAISIPIARTDLGTDFKYYYSVLLFPTLYFLLYLAVSELPARYFKPAILLASLVLCFYFIADIKAKKIYTSIHFKNKERISDALFYSKPCYYPYDEPSVSTGVYLYLLDDDEHPELQKSIGKNNYFAMDSSIQQLFGGDGSTFRVRSKHTLDCYRDLSKRTFINFDVSFEKR